MEWKPGEKTTEVSSPGYKGLLKKGPPIARPSEESLGALAETRSEPRSEVGHVAHGTRALHHNGSHHMEFIKPYHLEPISLVPLEIFELDRHQAWPPTRAPYENGALIRARLEAPFVLRGALVRDCRWRAQPRDAVALRGQRLREAVPRHARAQPDPLSGRGGPAATPGARAVVRLVQPPKSEPASIAGWSLNLLD